MAELRTHFHLFVYGTLRSDGAANAVLAACERIGAGEIGGVLYDIDGEHPALVLYGNAPVAGEIWRCPTELLQELDAYEQVDTGLMRRVGATVRHLPTGTAMGCWTYVAGPALSHKLTPQSRIAAWPVRN